MTSRSINAKKFSFIVLFIGFIFSSKMNAQSSGSLPPIIKEPSKNKIINSKPVQQNLNNASSSDMVNIAEHRENLKTCLDGRYPALCKHSMLSDDEAAAVSKAEKRENFKTCTDGRYPALCKHELLDQSEYKKSLDAEIRENLKVCLDGRYPALCNHQLLSGNEQAKVNAAERRENRKICLDGRYPALCDKSLLD